ncbi:MAG: hypothetical protein ACRDRU_07390 [Pseudonocardiaceae bacterium]
MLPAADRFHNITHYPPFPRESTMRRGLLVFEDETGRIHLCNGAQLWNLGTHCREDQWRGPGLGYARCVACSGKGHTMTVTICLPATEVISIDAMASMDTVVWWRRLCDHHGTAMRWPKTPRGVEGDQHRPGCSPRPSVEVDRCACPARRDQRGCSTGD